MIDFFIYLFFSTKLKGLRIILLPPRRWQGVLQWLVLTGFSSQVATGYPCPQFECRCGTELFLTLVDNTSTSPQEIALYPQIHQCRWMGDEPTACTCGRMQLACKDSPNFSSLSSPTGLKSFVSGKSQTVLAASPTAWTLQRVPGHGLLLLGSAWRCLSP